MRFSAPEAVILSVHAPVQMKMGFIRKPDVLDELGGSVAFPEKPGRVTFAGLFVAVAKLLVNGYFVRVQLQVCAGNSLCSAVATVQLLGEVLQGRFRGQCQNLACL